MSGDEPVRVEISAYEAGPMEVGMPSTRWPDFPPGTHKGVFLPITDSSVGGLEPWMVEHLMGGGTGDTHPAGYADGVRIIAAAIERILREGGER